MAGGGLDRLIEFSDYIAISVPEWRIHKPKTYKKHVAFLADYIKNKKPSIDIHLLGCTEKDMLRQNNFCTSSDSTSWISGIRYGNIQNVRWTVNDIKKQKREELEPIIREQYEKYGKLYNKPINQNIIKCIEDCYVSAVICKTAYEKYAGNQD